jgi:hypothetical protein
MAWDGKGVVFNDVDGLPESAILVSRATYDQLLGVARQLALALRAMNDEAEECSGAWERAERYSPAVEHTAGTEQQAGEALAAARKLGIIE